MEQARAELEHLQRDEPARHVRLVDSFVPRRSLARGRASRCSSTASRRRQTSRGRTSSSRRRAARLQTRTSSTTTLRALRSRLLHRPRARRCRRSSSPGCSIQFPPARSARKSRTGADSAGTHRRLRDAGRPDERRLLEPRRLEPSLRLAAERAADHCRSPARCTARTTTSSAATCRSPRRAARPPRRASGSSTTAASSHADDRSA